LISALSPIRIRFPNDRSTTWNGESRQGSPEPQSSAPPDARIRARGIEYRSTPHGPVDMQVNTQHGGRIVYWNEPDGHVWEALTVSYARQSV
jgi:hypothetical protein